MCSSTHVRNTFILNPGSLRCCGLGDYWNGSKYYSACKASLGDRPIFTIQIQAVIVNFAPDRSRQDVLAPQLGVVVADLLPGHNQGRSRVGAATADLHHQLVEATLDTEEATLGSIEGTRVDAMLVLLILVFLETGWGNNEDYVNVVKPLE